MRSASFLSVTALLTACCCLCSAGTEELVISEFLAINNAGYQDEDGDFSDWIEIHNTSGETVDVADLFLTDDAGELSKWRLPSAILDSGEYLVVFASKKDRNNVYYVDILAGPAGSTKLRSRRIELPGNNVNTIPLPEERM